MSGLVDQRVVEMRFDNKQFEDGVATSMSTLDKLKQALNFTGSEDGINRLGQAIGGLTLSPLQNGIEAVTSKFDMLHYIGLKVLTDIANKVTSVGEKLVKDFTIDPIKTGLQEYETQINSVQTILANTKSKGTTLEDVNAALDELNQYADKTIYNFTQMTQNIGRFTAAGLDLKTSTSAIQGIANLAAVSGSTSQQASTAMYQLSQALSSGALKLQDWNSVVNAGMGGELFQEQLKQTSREMVTMAKEMQNLSSSGMETKEIADKFGMSLKDVEDIIQNGYNVNVDEAIDKAGSFRESLKSGWITSAVLAKTLNRITRSGALEYLEGHLKESSKYTMEEIKAMYDEASAADDADAAIKQLSETLADSTDLTADQINSVLNMADTAEKAATEVKTFTQLMDTLKEAAQSGWTQTWEYLIGDFEEAKKLFTSISNEVGGLIGATSDFRNGILKNWHDMEGRDKLLSGLANGYKILKETMSSFGSGVFNSFFDRDQEQVIVDLGFELLDLSNRFSHFMQNISESDEFNVFLEKVSIIGEAVGGLFGNLWWIFSNLVGVAIKFLTIFSPFFDIFLNFITLLASGLHTLDAWLDKTNLVEEVFKRIERVINIVKGGVETLLTAFSKYTGVDLSFFDIANFGNDPIKQWEAFTAVVQDLWNRFEKFVGIDFKFPDFSNMFGGIDTFLDVIDHSFESINLDEVNTLSGALSEIYGAATDAIKELFSLGGVEISLPSWVDLVTGFEKFKSYIAPLGDIVREVFGLFADFFSNEAPEDQTLLQRFLGLLVNLGSVVGSLLSVFQPVGKLIFNAATAIKTFIQYLRQNGVISTFVAGLKMLWGYLKIAASTVKDLFDKFIAGANKAEGTFSLERFLGIIQSIVGVIATGGLAKLIFTLASGVQKLSDIFVVFGKSGKSVANILDALAGGVQNGGEGIVGTLKGMFDGIIGAFGDKDGASLVESFRSIAVSIAILVGAVFILSTIDGKALAASCGALTAMFADLFGSMAAFNKVSGSVDGKNMAKLGSALLKVGAAVLLLALAIKTIAKLEPEQALVGFAIVTALLVELAAFGSIMNGLTDGFMETSKSMVKISVGLLILAKAVKSLGQLKREEAIQGVIAVGALFAIIGAFCRFMASFDQNLTRAVGSALLKMAASIFILTFSVKKLGEMDLKTLAKGVGAVSVLIAMFGVFGKLTEKSKGFFGKGAGVLLMAAGIVVLTGAIERIAQINSKKIAKSLGTIGVGLLFMVVAMNSMSHAIGGAFAILICAAAINAFVPAIQALGRLSIEEIAKAMGTLAGTLLIFGLAATILSPIALEVLMIGGAIALLGAGVLMLGPGLILVAAGLISLGGALPIFAGEFIAFLTVVLGGIISLIPMLGIIATQIITTLCNTLLNSAGSILTTAVNLGLTLCHGLLQLIPALVEVGITLIVALINGIADCMDAIISAGIRLMITFINGLATGLRENGPVIIQAVGNLISSIIEMVITAIQMIAEKIPGIGGKIAEGLEEAKEDINNLLTSSTEDVNAAASEMEKGYSNVASGITQSATGAVSDAAQSMIKPDEYSAAGQANADSYNQSFTQNIGQATSVPISSLSPEQQSSLAQHMTDPEGFSSAGQANANSYMDAFGQNIGTVEPSKLSELGYNLDAGTAEGITNNMGLVTDAGGQMSDETLAEMRARLGINSPSTKGAEMGMYLDQGIAQGMRDNKQVIFDAITEIFNQYQSIAESQNSVANKNGALIIDKFVTGMRSRLPRITKIWNDIKRSGDSQMSSMRTKFYRHGVNIVAGLINGMNSKLGDLRSKAREITDVVNKTVEKAEEINSPSKRFFRYGQYLDQGLILGMGSMTKDVARSSNDLGMSVVDSMSDAVSYAAAIADGAYELNPTITPVMDLSYVREGFGSIDSLASRQINLQANFENSKWDMLDSISTRISNNEALTNKLVDRMDKQNAKMDGLIDLLSNTDIVLDGDTVVGRLLPRIDKGLGRRAKAVGGRR